MSFGDYVADAKGGLCCLLPNMLSRLGWHPADGFTTWLGEVVSEQMDGNPDATFKQVMKGYIEMFQPGRVTCVAKCLIVLEWKAAMV